MKHSSLASQIKRGFVLTAAVGLPFAVAPSAVLAQTTPITNVVVIFQENVSFDHYFGTYPNAQNNSGEQPFSAYPGTPSVNGLTPALLNNNPNKNAAGTAQVNPSRLSPAHAYTCGAGSRGWWVDGQIPTLHRPNFQ